MGLVRGMALSEFIQHSVKLANVVVLQPGAVDLIPQGAPGSEARLEGGREKMRTNIMTKMTTLTAP